MPIRDTYVSREVFKILEVNAQQIQYWMLKGIFEPLDRGGGTGHTRTFSFANIMEIGLTLELVEDGLKLDSVASILNNLWEKEVSFFKLPVGKPKNPENQEILAYRFEKENSAFRFEIFPFKRTMKKLRFFYDEGCRANSINLDVLKADLIKKIESNM